MKKETLSTTIERTLSLLEIFFQYPDGLNPQEILDQLKISRSTLFTLLKELKDIGYLEQAEIRGKYIAGPRLRAWSGSSAPSYQTLMNVFQQEIHSKNFAETIALAVPGTEGILLLDQKEGTHPIRAVYSPGEPILKDSAAHQILTPPFTEETTQNGFSLYATEDSLELAIPICSDGIKPVAGLLLFVPQYRWTKEKLLAGWLDELRTMAAHISYRLGALQYTPYHQSLQSTLQPTKSMNELQISQFLAGPWTARLASIRPDGHPHVIPVWQEWDGKKFRILAWHGSQWVDYVRKNGQVSLTIDEPWSPYRRVVTRGWAEEAKNITPQTQAAIISQMANRYLGQETQGQFLNQVETIFTIHPETMRGWMGLQSETK